MLAVVDAGAQTCQGAFLVLGLVTSLGTFDEDFLFLTRVGIGPDVTGTYAGFDLVDVLTACTARAEGVPLDFAFVDLHVERLCLGQHGHGGSAGVDSSLRLGDGDTLHAMHARLVLEDAIDSFAGDVEDDFLVATGSTFAETRDRDFPTFHLAEFRVHAEEVAGKERSLVATCSAADFHRHVLAVLGVGRDEQQLDFLLQLRDALFAGRSLLASHLLHVGVVLGGHQFLCLFQSFDGVDVFLAGLHDVLQVLVFLCQLHIALLVGNDVGVGDERADFLKSRHKTFQFLKYIH